MRQCVSWGVYEAKEKHVNIYVLFYKKKGGMWVWQGSFIKFNTWCRVRILFIYVVCICVNMKWCRVYNESCMVY